MTTDLTFDHKHLEGAQETRRYFAKFEGIIGHLHKVAAITMDEGLIARKEGEIVERYLERLAHTFRALSYKYLMTNRAAGSGKVSIDKTESGFPVFAEMIQLATDATQADVHLKSLPEQDRLKKEQENQTPL